MFCSFKTESYGISIIYLDDLLENYLERKKKLIRQYHVNIVTISGENIILYAKHNMKILKQ